MAGIALGVVLVTLGGQTSFSANIGSVTRAAAVSLLHAAPSRRDFTQRNVARKNIPLRNDNGTTNTAYITVKADSSLSAAKAEAVTTCDAVRSAVEKIRQVYTNIVAGNVSNADVRQAMYDAIAHASDDACAK